MVLPLKNPNLPSGRVVHAAVSRCSDKLSQKLSEFNIQTIETVNNGLLNQNISGHTDMLINNCKSGFLLYDESQGNNIVKYLTIGYKCELLNNLIQSPYPTDSLLNAIILGNNLICNKNTVSKQITDLAALNGMNIINVNQGYTKCSVCVVSDNALITDDESIYKACTVNNIDTLYISKGSIKLNGFDYGFIGGCTGKINKDKLLFNGDINLHKDCGKIIDFLNIYNIIPVIIDNEPLYDIGSIIPLTEDI